MLICRRAAGISRCGPDAAESQTALIVADVLNLFA